MGLGLSKVVKKVYPMVFKLTNGGDCGDGKGKNYWISLRSSLAVSSGPLRSQPDMPRRVLIWPTKMLLAKKCSKKTRATRSCSSLSWAGPKMLAKYVCTRPVVVVVPLL